jgi:hypothetical protein
MSLDVGRGREAENANRDGQSSRAIGRGLRSGGKKESRLLLLGPGRAGERASGQRRSAVRLDRRRRKPKLQARACPLLSHNTTTPTPAFLTRTRLLLLLRTLLFHCICRPQPPDSIDQFLETASPPCARAPAPLPPPPAALFPTSARATHCRAPPSTASPTSDRPLFLVQGTKKSAHASSSSLATQPPSLCRHHPTIEESPRSSAQSHSHTRTITTSCVPSRAAPGPWSPARRLRRRRRAT